MSMARAEFLMLLGLALLTAVLVSGCTPMQETLSDMDRDYGVAYDATSGRGEVRAKWTPSAKRGEGRPSVSAAIDFKQTVEAMDF